MLQNINITYASSIDDISALKGSVTFVDAPGSVRQPALVVLHGWSQSFTDFDHAALERYARRGLFVVAVGMRGDGGGSRRDGSGREVFDIADALAHVRDQFADHVDPSLAFVAGWSGGGTNALAAAMRFPDTFAGVVAYFPVTDYGYCEDGLCRASEAYGASIIAAIGDPDAVPGKYRARFVREGFPVNYFGGQAFVFHDTADALVPVSHSRKLVAAAIGRNVFYSETGPETSARWLHGLPAADGPLSSSEDIWLSVFSNGQVKPWTFPHFGRARVHGWLRTSPLEVLLGNLDDHVADLDFDLAQGRFTIVPATGPMDVSVRTRDWTWSDRISEITEVKMPGLSIAELGEDASP